MPPALPTTGLAMPLTVERFFALAEEGVLSPDDRVELLEGVIVAMSPQNPRHAAATSRTARALVRALGERAALRVQLPLVLGPASAPEPDVAVVPGRESDYDRRHPTSALLVVEVADVSLLQDRLTKAAVYAGAEVAEYWIVNLRDDRVEVFRDPDAGTRLFRAVATAERGEGIVLVAFPDARVAVADLLPARA